MTNSLYCMALLFLFAAFLTAALVPAFPTDISQDIRYAAQLTRRIVHDAGIGTMLTHMDRAISTEFQDYPFGIMEYYSDTCSTKGDLLLYMSDLQMSARNMHRQPDKAAFTIRALTEYDNPKSGNKTTPVQSPRFTLFGRIGQVPQDRFEEAMACFAAKHPEAKAWVGFHDFHFYNFQVRGIYYVGGFGGINYIGWIPLALYQESTPKDMVVPSGFNSQGHLFRIQAPNAH